jgi:cullin-associated NEDD8-dissociated protein 1
MQIFEVEVLASGDGPCTLQPSGTTDASAADSSYFSSVCIDVESIFLQKALIAAAPALVDELDLLLTDGRMSTHSKGVLESAYTSRLLLQPWSADRPVEATRIAQELAASLPEYQSTNLNVETGERAAPTEEPSQNRQYKAIVIVNLHGGSDSHNLLVPHSNCGDRDLYEEYKASRGIIAHEKADLLQINVPASTQPCDTFGLDPTLVNVRSIYEDGDAAWIANIGNLVEPMTAAEYASNAKVKPPSLFGHAQQRVQIQSMMAQNPNAKGVLGRAMDTMIERSGYKSNLFNIDRGMTPKILTGASKSPVSIDPVMGGGQITRFTWLQETYGGYNELLRNDDMAGHFENITRMSTSSVFGETYTELMGSSLAVTEELAAQLEDATVDTVFTEDISFPFGYQLKMVARLIKANLLADVERAVFVTAIAGFDTHTSAEDTKGPVLPQKLKELDNGLKAFTDELKLQGVWDDVVIMTVSDFGRTLSSNANGGTDHGKYFACDSLKK